MDFIWGDPTPVQYTVLMICPEHDFEGKTNAYDITNACIEHLNIPNHEPGARFSPNVTAKIKQVHSIDEAVRRVKRGDVALVLSLDDEPEKHIPFAKLCERHDTGVCYFTTQEEIEQNATQRGATITPPNSPVQLSFNPEPKEIPATFMPKELLAAPIVEDADFQKRCGGMIMVLAMEVMRHHWKALDRKGPTP